MTFIKYSEAMLMSRTRKEKGLSFYPFHSRKQNEIIFIVIPEWEEISLKF